MSATSDSKTLAITTKLSRPLKAASKFEDAWKLDTDYRI